MAKAARLKRGSGRGGEGPTGGWGAARRRRGWHLFPLEGRIAHGLGNLEQAEALFRDTRAEFVRRDRHYVAAMLGLELAAVYLRQGKLAEAEAEATVAVEVFQVLRVSYEAGRAVRYLQEACRRRVATAALALRVVRYLQRLETNPTLRFEP